MSLSNITLTAAVRQNLLSLQDTASLLATTQGRLATGKKVNSALDNPTNFFTAAGLDARASDISNLLDSIGNGVQVLQAANTGITSLSKLVDTAKSIANQVLQQPTGYTTKANVTIATPGVAGTATNLTNGGAVGGLIGKTLIFKTSTGTTTLTLSNVTRRRQRQLDQQPQHRTFGGGRSAAGKLQQQRLDHLHLDQRCRFPDHHRHRRLCGSAGRFLHLGGRFGNGDVRRGHRASRRPGVAGHALVAGQLSTTRSLRRSPPRRRMRPSTASTC